MEANMREVVQYLEAERDAGRLSEESFEVLVKCCMVQHMETLMEERARRQENRWTEWLNRGLKRMFG